MSKIKLGIELQKKHVVCTAHRLMEHPGACKNLHGHNYVLTFHISAKEFDHEGTGMIMDFADVKKDICGLADYYFDHKTVLQKSDPLVDVLMPMCNGNLTVFDDYPPTAENMAAFLLMNTNAYLVKEHGGKVLLSKVDVEETPNNAASAAHLE